MYRQPIVGSVALRTWREGRTRGTPDAHNEKPPHTPGCLPMAQPQNRQRTYHAMPAPMSAPTVQNPSK